MISPQKSHPMEIIIDDHISLSGHPSASELEVNICDQIINMYYAILGFVQKKKSLPQKRYTWIINIHTCHGQLYRLR